MGVGNGDRLSAGLVPMFQPYCLAQAICGPSDRVVYRLSRVPLKHENRVRVPAWSTLFCCTGVWGWERGVDKLEPNRRMGVCVKLYATLTASGTVSGLPVRLLQVQHAAAFH